MKMIFAILLILSQTLAADVFLIEEDVISYDVPEALLKRPTAKDDIFIYRDSQKQARLIVQLFRKIQWADWHMKGLKKSKATFQKFFDTELGGSNGEILNDVHYNEKDFELTLDWSQTDGVNLLSRMKLTSFGCVAFHVPYKEAELESAKLLLDDVISSLKVPDQYKYAPTSMVSDLMSNVGGGFFFLVVSLAYLMFSLFKRSQLRQMKLERRMREVKESRLQTQIN